MKLTSINRLGGLSGSPLLDINRGSHLSPGAGKH